MHAHIKTKKFNLYTKFNLYETQNLKTTKTNIRPRITQDQCLRQQQVEMMYLWNKNDE